MPVDRWEVFCEEDFGIADLALHPSCRKTVTSQPLGMVLLGSRGPLLRILERILFGFFDFGSQRDPKLVPDYTLPILHVIVELKKSWLDVQRFWVFFREF